MSDPKRIYSVSEITAIIKQLLEESLPTIWLEGEISNFKAHSSGHYYFTLKDKRAQISAVMWRSRTASLPFIPEDGMQVQALGNIRVYEKSGRYQIDVLMMQEAGLGKLQMEFERLKQKLQAEGMFDSAHKKDLPPFPQTIGVITSATGAAIRDIINVLKRRAPHVQIILRPVVVQGADAAADIARAIEEFNRFAKVDVLIIGRGGGSLEDLWAFNEERVARAIFNSKIPVVSAVGHEIDFTIADFVADLRAPTPSAAAELAVPDYVQLKEQLRATEERLRQRIRQYLQQQYEKIHTLGVSYGMRRPQDLIRQYAVQVDELHSQLQKRFTERLRRQKELLHQLEKRLDNLNPQKVLERGYSISYINGRIVQDIRAVNTEEQLLTQLANGTITSRVTGTKEREDK